jgi:NAD-dependent SIR2 family protein deacetylase
MLAAMAAILESNPDVEGIQAAIEMLKGRRVAVLTGAGVSTDSGIPDYRGKGVSKRTPMNISDFLSSHHSRQRYWAGAHLGWESFHNAQPNQGHLALAAMEQAGIIEGIISQNVDGLHRQAGSAHVVDLHGCLDRVVCLDCGQQFDRSGIEEQLSSLNPWLDEITNAELAPDGDVIVSNFDSMSLPECTVCGGMLKPDVVFFGEYVSPKIFTAASNLIKRADVLLIAGSSLMVNSGIRLLEQAKRQRMPIVIVNRGETKGDKKATLKLEHGTSDVLSSLAVGLGAGNLYEDIQ